VDIGTDYGIFPGVARWQETERLHRRVSERSLPHDVSSVSEGHSKGRDVNSRVGFVAIMLRQASVEVDLLTAFCRDRQLDFTTSPGQWARFLRPPSRGAAPFRRQLKLARLDRNGVAVQVHAHVAELD
jgi:hypothetical protein